MDKEAIQQYVEPANTLTQPRNVHYHEILIPETEHIPRHNTIISDFNIRRNTLHRWI